MCVHDTLPSHASLTCVMRKGGTLSVITRACDGTIREGGDKRKREGKKK